DRARFAVARRRVQHDMPRRTGRDPVSLSQGEPVDSVRSAREPARSRRVRRAAVSRRRHADWTHRLRDLLRLAVSRSDSPAPGERIVVAPLDVSALRHERATRRGHHMLAHLRTEAYPVYAEHRYPPLDASRSGASRALSYETNVQRIDEAKRDADARALGELH